MFRVIKLSDKLSDKLIQDKN